jgi:1-acyl-sn-glycerol-3-phosphate acyltransferase
MKLRVRLTNWVLRNVFRALCRIDSAELKKIPTQGPLILVGNHINFLEAPLMMPYLDTLSVTGLAKRETWDNPLFNFLFTGWEIIPIDRGMVDREAFRLSLDALAEGKVLVVFPEGTRSNNGQMLPGKPGVVALALRSRAPLVPVGFYGHENFWENLKRLRRTEFHVVVGKPFTLNLDDEGMDRDIRQAAADEIMCKIAELLPEDYHGHYRRPDFKYHYLSGIAGGD